MVGSENDTSLDHTGAQVTVGQFRGWSIGGDVTSIEPDPVSGGKDRRGLMSTVVLHSVLILRFSDSQLRFL
jgi:hypothetical protein